MELVYPICEMVNKTEMEDLKKPLSHKRLCAYIYTYKYIERVRGRAIIDKKGLARNYKPVVVKHHLKTMQENLNNSWRLVSRELYIHTPSINSQEPLLGLKLSEPCEIVAKVATRGLRVHTLRNLANQSREVHKVFFAL